MGLEDRVTLLEYEVSRQMKDKDKALDLAVELIIDICNEYGIKEYRGKKMVSANSIKKRLLNRGKDE